MAASSCSTRKLSPSESVEESRSASTRNPEAPRCRISASAPAANEKSASATTRRGWSRAGARGCATRAGGPCRGRRRSRAGARRPPSPRRVAGCGGLGRRRSRRTSASRRRRLESRGRLGGGSFPLDLAALQDDGATAERRRLLELMRRQHHRHAARRAVCGSSARPAAVPARRAPRTARREAGGRAARVARAPA